MPDTTTDQTPTDSASDPASDPASDHVVHSVRATADGSRATTDDRALDVQVTTADGDDDAGVTPEHLMAAALAGCLQQALVIAAGTLGQHLEPSVAATVTLSGAAGSGFSAAFDLVVTGLEGEHADDVLQQATSICPFTTALDGRSLTVSRA